MNADSPLGWKNFCLSSLEETETPQWALPPSQVPRTVPGTGVNEGRNERDWSCDTKTENESKRGSVVINKELSHLCAPCQRGITVIPKQLPGPMLPRHFSQPPPKQTASPFSPFPISGGAKEHTEGNSRAWLSFRVKNGPWNTVNQTVGVCAHRRTYLWMLAGRPPNSFGCSIQTNNPGRRGLHFQLHFTFRKWGLWGAHVESHTAGKW